MRPVPGLHRLARLHGVQTAYYDNDGRRIGASAEVLMGALRALRVPLRGAAHVPRLLAHRERELWERVVEPVVVAWQGGDRTPLSTFTIRLPARHQDRPVRTAISFEDGGLLRWPLTAADLVPVDRAEVDGVEYVQLRAPLPTGLDLGYHDLHVTIGEGRSRERHESLLISAPRLAASWEAVVGRRGWGLFAPLHALWEDSGGGLQAAPPPGLHLLDRLAGRVAEHGGTVIGTLPLMAAFLDRPYEPSPYAPVSRLFWNELYLDPPAAAGTRATIEAEPYRSGLFDPGAAMAAKKPALEAAARSFFDPGGSEPDELASFRARNPNVDDYSRFRAIVARRGAWRDWQDRLRARDVRPGDYDIAVARYHVYVQWLAERQLTAVKERAESRGVGLYLDLPLGVHPDGYDVWRERELFAIDATAGAPPDPLAANGQDWGFPPLHPEAGRLERHRYLIACIRNHLRFARVLRIDHVMQLHRMFWVVGGDSQRGVYVQYPAEELYAILCLESRRARAVVVGEDLGTVPRAVRDGMRRHGLPGMYVLQFELTDEEGGRALVPRRVPTGALASIGTHDTPTFAGWWTGRDAEIRNDLGEATEEEAAAERAGRAEMRRKLIAGLRRDTALAAAKRTAGDEPPGDEAARDEPAGDEPAGVAAVVHQELLRRLGRSDAGLVLATMEDLWLEPEPQNVPGTLRAENWRRPASRPIDALAQPTVAAQLDALNESREGSHG
jgi:4-alpha-glucanotransferase